MFTKKIFFVLWCITQQLWSSSAEWTILLIMQGDNNLSFFMQQNIALLKKIGSSKDVNILVQWDEPFKHTTWRYKIGYNRLLDNASLAQDMGTNPEAELIDAARWAFTKYPAKKQALIFWNHGSGILDEERDWNSYRGILYDFSSGKCLTNASLLRGLQVIQQEVLIGKKFDLIGMDACLMAMLEIGYQIKEFTDLFVASENIEHAPGWHYSAIFKQLIKSPRTYNAVPFAHLIVRSFYEFHHPHNNIYTQSIMDLTTISNLKENVAQLAAISLSSKQKDLYDCIVQARKCCTEFDKGHFIDLYDFYHLLLKELTKKKHIPIELQKTLKSTLENGLRLIKKTIIGYTKGNAYKNSQGLSIYFPRTKKLHPSYHETLFAKETLWAIFIDHFKTT